MSLTAILEATGILRLISGMLRTFLELAAYSSVEMVSSRLMEAGDTVAMIDVFVLPPSESCSSRVSFDSLEEMEKGVQCIVSLGNTECSYRAEDIGYWEYKNYILL